MIRLFFVFLVIMAFGVPVNSFADVQKNTCRIKGLADYIDRKEKVFSFFVQQSGDYIGECAVFNSFGIEPLGIKYKDNNIVFSAKDLIEGSVDVTKSEKSINRFNVEFGEIYDIHVLEKYSDRRKGQNEKEI